DLPAGTAGPERGARRASEAATWTSSPLSCTRLVSSKNGASQLWVEDVGKAEGWVSALRNAHTECLAKFKHWESRRMSSCESGGAFPTMPSARLLCLPLLGPGQSALGVLQRAMAVDVTPARPIRAMPRTSFVGGGSARFRGCVKSLWGSSDSRLLLCCKLVEVSLLAFAPPKLPVRRLRMSITKKSACLVI
ncbi:unnamed protein product, partial [Symbiodinium sp. CCMP2456]